MLEPPLKMMYNLMKTERSYIMKEGYTSDCYICTMDNFDVICDTLINRGCNILNAVPTDYYINGAYINATRMCITYERPNTPAGKDIEKNLDH